MTVGRAISPECSTDERREWQKGAAALAISSRRPTGWLGSRMIRSMFASGSSPVAAASCRTCSFARLAAPAAGAGYLVKIVSNRLLMLMVGSLILALSARALRECSMVT